MDKEAGNVEGNPNLQSTLNNFIMRDDTEDKQQLAEIMLHSARLGESHTAFIEKIFSGDYVQRSDRNISALSEFSWEYVIVLKNPDSPSESYSENSAVSESFAEACYREAFKSKKTESLHRDRIAFLNEVHAFVNVYKGLQSFSDGKKLYQGGRMSIHNNEAFDNYTKPGDFTTLLRNALVYKLVGCLGLKAKQLISQNGEFIFIVIAADESDLEMEAERVMYSKELEIALTDLQSLIPCDQSLRPMHLLKADSEIKKIYKEVKPFFVRAFGLEKDSHRKVDIHYEPIGVTPIQWQTYKIFLCLLKDGIQKIEKSIASHKNQMFLFQKLIRESIDKANLGLKEEEKLKNLWDKLGIQKPIHPFAEYRRSEDDLHDKWRSHENEHTGKRTLFRNVERLRLLSSHIDTQINLESLMEKEFIVAHFPLPNSHLLKGKNEQERLASATSEDLLLRNILIDFRSAAKGASLIDSWNTSLINQKIPLNKIKNYFGEKVALYFEFLRFFQVSLLVPSILGLVVFIVQKSMNQDDDAVLVLNIVYSVFMTVWATVYLEYWKRREAALAIMWGQTKFEKTEIPRTQFKGEFRRSPITDEMDEVHFESSARAKYFLLSCFVTLCFVCMVIGVVAGLLIFKFIYSGKYILNGVDFTLPVCSILNAIQIQIFNFIYSKLVRKLTDLENHKTDLQYEDSLILKTFVFQFVNSFNSLAYIAFIKTYVEGCIVNNSEGQKESIKGASCIDELFSQLISIFLVSYVKNLIEIGLPYIKYQIRRRKKVQKIDAVSIPKDIRNKIESQIYLEPYLTRGNDGTIDDYLELAVQFGYLTLFALAFPLSTFLAFIGLWLEMHTDKLKLVRLVQRPIPFAIKDIGTWWHIFSAVCALAIFSNTALFCFTSMTFKVWTLDTNYTYLIYAIVVVILLIFRGQLQSWIPDVAEKYEIVKARHEFVVERMFRGKNKTDIPEEIETYDGTIYFSANTQIKNTDFN